MLIRNINEYLPWEDKVCMEFYDAIYQMWKTMENKHKRSQQKCIQMPAHIIHVSEINIIQYVITNTKSHINNTKL